MNSKTLKVILGAALVASMSVTSLLAQDPPAAEVDGEGNLVLNPGTAEEQTINKPDGSVDQNGDLTVGGVTITKPTATVLQDGSLDLGGGNVLAVPDGPPSALPAVIEWFNTGTGPNNETATVDDVTYYSWVWKFLLTGGLPEGFVYMDEFSAVVYPIPESGTPDGAWCYFFDFPVAGQGGNWVYLSSLNFPDRMVAVDTKLNGWIYLLGDGYNKWYVVEEVFGTASPDGTYIYSSATDFFLVKSGQ